VKKYMNQPIKTFDDPCNLQGSFFLFIKYFREGRLYAP
jgi:hypothetical protein